MLKKNGVKQIESTIGSFTKVIKNLDEGIKLNDTQTEANRKKMEELQRELDTLTQSNKKAESFKTKLSELIS